MSVMNFSDLLKPQIDEPDEQESMDSELKDINEASSSPEDILRDGGFKIKLVTPTSFGVQIDLAKKYEEKSLQTILKDYNIKIKDKSVFIVY